MRSQRALDQTLTVPALVLSFGIAAIFVVMLWK